MFGAKQHGAVPAVLYWRGSAGMYGGNRAFTPTATGIMPPAFSLQAVKRASLFLVLPLIAACSPVPADNIPWKTYHNEPFGLEIRYPGGYFLCSEGKQAGARRPDFDYITLRQNTASAADCRTVGKRVGFYMYRLGRVLEFSLSGKRIKLTKRTTVDEIAEQYLKDDNRPMVRRACESKDLNGRKAVICTERAPGEAAGRTSGIYEIHALTIFEMKNGERILARIANDAGGTPYTRDSALRDDVTRIFNTLR
ncbi:MAG: hypothetical protein KKH28_00915 [Elusimicrobia bacterium]|nr:hypothetical protein [Elusimicrobiota bacterium]